MTFLQTSGGQILLKHFTECGERNINTVGCRERAAEMMRGFAKIHGMKNVQAVGKKANQKIKAKVF